ncbi:MAG: lactate utilization protein [Hyphomicrobiales bacterium]|nr:lactate utilization protein [Hyphomicrobiales bacterium]
MSLARDEILATIRRSLGVNGAEAPRRAAVADRLARSPVGVIPKRSQVNGAQRMTLFKRQAEEALATVTLVPDAASVPGEAARYLRDSNLPATLRIGDDPRLAAMPWDTTAIDVSKGPSGGGDLNALSHAFGAIAETGTLAMVSGAANPTTLNFLPDNHLVVVAAGDLTGSFEDLLEKLRGHYGKEKMPRTLNLITGPSRSADIEQTLILGAHGPRKLHVIVVEG